MKVSRSRTRQEQKADSCRSNKVQSIKTDFMLLEYDLGGSRCLTHIGGSQNIGRRSLNWLKTFLDNTLRKSPLDGASMLCETLWKHISRDGVLARLTCALIIDITWKFYATKLWNNYSLQSVMKIEFLMNMISSVCLVVSMWKKLRYCYTILEAALLLWI